jgi:hypothetical protein
MNLWHIILLKKFVFSLGNFLPQKKRADIQGKKSHKCSYLLLIGKLCLLFYACGCGKMVKVKSSLNPLDWRSKFLSSVQAIISRTSEVYGHPNMNHKGPPCLKATTFNHRILTTKWPTRSSSKYMFIAFCLVCSQIWLNYVLDDSPL